MTKAQIIKALEPFDDQEVIYVFDFDLDTETWWWRPAKEVRKDENVGGDGKGGVVIE
jgi:hypothetical protein